MSKDFSVPFVVRVYISNSRAYPADSCDISKFHTILSVIIRIEGTYEVHYE